MIKMLKSLLGNFGQKVYLIIAVLVTCVIAFFAYNVGHRYGYSEGEKIGYNNGYSKGYSDGYEDKGKLTENTVKTETKIEYVKIPYNGNDVQITTPPPKVTVSVNGKKQEITQKQETADLQVKTETEVKLKLPEKRWSVGVGYSDDKSVGYMLKAPLKVGKNSDNLGLWIAGSGKKRVMGGISISF